MRVRLAVIRMMVVANTSGVGMPALSRCTYCYTGITAPRLSCWRRIIARRCCTCRRPVFSRLITIGSIILVIVAVVAIIFVYGTNARFPRLTLRTRLPWFPLRAYRARFSWFPWFPLGSSITRSPRFALRPRNTLYSGFPRLTLRTLRTPLPWWTLLTFLYMHVDRERTRHYEQCRK